MKSFFGNVFELFALLCGSTELKQSISIPFESVVTPSGPGCSKADER